MANQPAQLTPISHADLGRGLNQFDAEDHLRDGEWEDLRNADPTPWGSLTKRAGYQQRGGGVPIRVRRVQWTGGGSTTITFHVDCPALASAAATQHIRIGVWGWIGRSSPQTGTPDFVHTVPTFRVYTATITGPATLVVTSATGATCASATDDYMPDLAVYGAAFGDVYTPDDATRDGWVTGLDTFRRELEQRAVCVLRGAVFAEYEASELPSGLQPAAFTPGQSVSVSAATVSPLIWPSTDVSARSRGYLRSTAVQGHSLVCTSAAWQSGSSVKFTLSSPGLTPALAPAYDLVGGGYLSAGLDYLTVSGLTSALNGEWAVSSAVVGAGGDTLEFTCDVPGVSDSQWDISGAGGLAGVHTDRLTASTADVLRAGDSLEIAGSTPAIDSDSDVRVFATSGVYAHAGPLPGDVALAAATARATRETGLVIGAPANLFRGDMLSISSLSRPVRVVNVNWEADRAVSGVVGDGEFATVTLTVATYSIRAGDRLLLRGVGVHSGEIIVHDVPSTTTFRVESGETASVGAGGVVVGSTVGLDETLPALAWDDTLRVTSRWIPVEQYREVQANRFVGATSGSDSIEVNHSPFAPVSGQQPFIRSTMAAGSLYLSDGERATLRWDGERLSRAGLHRWQAIQFLSRHPAITQKIAGHLPVTVTGASGSTFTVAAGDEAQFAVGQRIEYIRAAAPVYSQYTIIAITSGTIKVDRALAESYVASSSICRTQSFRYYARLSWQTSDGREVGSAPAGYADNAVRIGASAGIVVGLCPPPHLDLQNRDRLTIQLYRTRDLDGGADANFYKVAEYPILHPSQPQMIRHLDVTPDEQLTELDSLQSLVPGEIGTGWAPPPLGTLISAAANRLLVGNIEEPRRLSITLRDPADTLGAYPQGTFRFSGLSHTGTPIDPNWDVTGGGVEVLTDEPFTSDSTITDSTYSDAFFTGVGGLPAAGRAIWWTGAFTGIGPFGITANQRYYMVPIDDFHFRLALTEADALTGTYITGVGISSFDTATFGFGTRFSVSGIAAVSLAVNLRTEFNDIYLVAHGLQTGDVGYFAVSNSTFRTQTAYYAIRIDADRFRLATSYEAAFAGTAIQILRTQGVTFAAQTQMTVTFGTNPAIEVGRSWVYIFGAANSDWTDSTPEIGDWYPVVAGSGTSYRVRKTNIGVTAAVPAFKGYAAIANSPNNLAVSGQFLTDTAGSWDTNFGQLTQRVPSSSYVGQGNAAIVAVRMAAAINAAQLWLSRLGANALATTASPPYLNNARVIAHAGNDFGSGELVIEQVSPQDPAVTVTTPLSSNMDVYVNGIRRSPGETVSAEARIFPSRIVRSYANYPDIFDSPYATYQSDSDSVIDVNPQDGQQVTGLMPFFGDSTVGSGVQEETLLVFKERGVYAVNVETRAVQKLETNGQGCTYPRSIAQTRRGVAFANEAGIWRINRQFELEYLGRHVRRKWSDTYARGGSDTELPVACNDFLRSLYRLSVPAPDGTHNEAALVYSHIREDGPDGVGAWTIHDGIPATWWANTGADLLFGTHDGRVCSIRRAGDSSDFRDDDAPIEMEATYAAQHFGVPAQRKLVAAVLASFRTPAGGDSAGTTIEAATEHSAAFLPLDTFRLDRESPTTGLSDLSPAAIRVLRFSLPDRRSSSLQLRVRNVARDEGVELTRLDFLVQAESDAGLEDAAATVPPPAGRPRR